MNHPGAHPAMPVPLATRAAASLGHLWRALVDAAGALRAGTGTSNRNPLERGTLDELSEHELKDIGASECQVADAAMRSYEDLRMRVNGGLG